MNGLEFQAEGHRYTLWGTELPSVSEIIRPLGEDLDELNGNLVSALEAAAERGIICHQLLELLLQGETEPEYPAAYGPYLDAIQLFLAEHAVEALAIEEPVYSEAWQYAGTPDLLCYLDGQLALLDYKFVAQVAKTKVKAQLNAYRKCYEEQGIMVEALYAVQFLPYGYRLYEVAIGEEEIDTCLKLWQLKSKKHPRGKII